MRNVICVRARVSNPFSLRWEHMRPLCAVLLMVLATLRAQNRDFAGEGFKAMEAQQYDAAVQAFTKAIEANPTDYAAHFNLGLAYTFLHKDAEAIAEYRR